jgi:hypothetical protein
VSIQDLTAAIKNRRCVLFLGAGVHYPPPQISSYAYPPEHRPPLGASLSRQLADECIAELNVESKSDVPDLTGLTDEQRVRRELERTIREEQREKERSYLRQHCEILQRTSWYYELHHQRGNLINKITAAVETGKEPSPIIRALAEMDFPIVITTNYDKLFEKALRKLQKPKEPVIRIYDSKGQQWTKDFPISPNPPDPQAPWLFKMHGCVSDPNSIVVTDEDYILFVMRMGDSPPYHAVPERLQVKFKEWPTLFVGYSLLDYNLRLLFRTLRRHVDLYERPATFSLDPFPDLLIFDTYGSRVEQGAAGPLVSFIEQDSWKFVPELYQSLFEREMPK